MRLAAYRSHLIKQLCLTSAMIGTASKFLNVTSRSVRHRCVRSMSTAATDNMLILENRNPHIMDDRITYCPTTKKFLFEGIELVHEIPFVVDDAFPKFDANEAIKKMMSSSTWPKQPYIKKDGTAYSAAGIKMKWREGNMFKEKSDSEMIEKIHLFLNDKPEEFREMSRLKSFLDEVIHEKGIVPYRTQWRIASGSDRTHGVVQFLGKFSDGTYALIDWDRTKNFGTQLTNNFEKKASEPIADLDDCLGMRAYLKVNMKRYILQNFYDMDVSYMAVVVLHPSLKTAYEIYEAPLLEQECIRLIHRIRKFN